MGQRRPWVGLKTTLVSLARVPGFLADPALTQTRYPTEEKKSRARICRENILWALRHAEVDEKYTILSRAWTGSTAVLSEQYMAGT